jgi:dihydroflavonol-4-reductase
VRILVTGGTGLLGNNVIRQALNRGFEVATLCRSGRNSQPFAGLNVTVYSVDLMNAENLSQVFERPFDAVIHCAAHIQIGWSRLEEGLRVNRDGTQRLLAEAAKHRTRFIHISTVNTLAVGTKEHPANEQTIGDGQVPCTYVVTKRAAEELAVQSAKSGQDVVIVHPGFMLGPWDWKPSSGRMIQGLQGFAPLAPSGGCTVCDPRDVANAILQAIERGKPGMHYILGGENLTYLELWQRIATELGKRGPFTYMRAPSRFVGSVVGDMLSKFLNRELDVNSAAIEMASQFHWYSSQRAMDELGYKPRPVHESIHDAVQWLRNNQLLAS